jgi:hypothetical protein
VEAVFAVVRSASVAILFPGSRLVHWACMRVREVGIELAVLDAVAIHPGVLVTVPELDGHGPDVAADDLNVGCRLAAWTTSGPHFCVAPSPAHLRHAFFGHSAFGCRAIDSSQETINQRDHFDFPPFLKFGETSPDCFLFTIARTA